MDRRTELVTGHAGCAAAVAEMAAAPPSAEHNAATAEARAAAAEQRCLELQSELAQARSQAQRLRQKVAMLEEVSLAEKATAGRAKHQLRELEAELMALRAAAAASEDCPTPAASPRSRNAADAGRLASKADCAGATGDRDSGVGVSTISWPSALNAAVDLGGLPYDDRLPGPEAAQKALSALRCALCSLSQFHRACSDLHSRLSYCPDRRELLEVIEVGTSHHADRLRQLEESIHRATLEMQSLHWGDGGLNEGEGWNIIGDSGVRRGQRHRGIGSSELEQSVVAAALQIFAELSRHLDELFPPLQSQRHLRERQEAVVRAKAAVASEEAHLAELTSGSASATTVTAFKAAQEGQHADTDSDPGGSRDDAHLPPQSPPLPPEEGVPHVPHAEGSAALSSEAAPQSTDPVVHTTSPVDDTAAAACAYPANVPLHATTVPLVEKVEEPALAAQKTAEASPDNPNSAPLPSTVDEDSEGVVGAANSNASAALAESNDEAVAATLEPPQPITRVQADQSEHCTLDGIAAADMTSQGQGSQHESEAGEANTSPAKAT